MKQLFLLLGVVLLGTIVALFGKRYFERNFVPEISFKSTKHDFDTLLYEKDAEIYFVFENTGKEKLKIYDIKTSCGCTIPEWNDKFLKPSQKDSFKVNYDIKNKGYFIKEIMVYSNSISSPDRLEIKGYVPFE